ncbi:MAG: 2-oxoacid:acceptor oxidoreductase subunit alpha [Planctomycetes bacterium]|jgi:2-oxoglutarate ferredoxin oxidoreductase subunit alpha|nr:2-oxoacid:acceptor oxidoreductase subunit alpha [Planctomycetota bacterium]
MQTTSSQTAGHDKGLQDIDQVVIRFAGDSGDGMQLTGDQFTRTTALMGNDIATFPDFPAEIRAPAGTLPGVSAFQLRFSSFDIHTPGDAPDVLVAMNPAALKVHLKELKKDGVLLLNTASFSALDLKKAKYDKDPRTDGTLSGWRVIEVDLEARTQEALVNSPLDNRGKDRCKNMFALGILYWMFHRDMEPTIKAMGLKFAKKPELVEANVQAMKAGHAYAETTEVFQTAYRVPPAAMKPGTYRNIMGNQALSLGVVAGAQKAGLQLFLGSYPITPASDILHQLSGYKHLGVITFQAEDEIAAVAAAIGASYSGCLGITSTSGPGIALKSEAIGLAVMAELPLIVLNVQRAGPSTGMPTKTQQADLLQVMYGRNGESPVCVIAASTPADAFEVGYEAVRIATKYMLPVVVLSDGYIANGSEPWLLPDPDKLPPIPVAFAPEGKPGEKFLPYARNPETLARPWAKPGTKGLVHRIGGLEKQDGSGNICYDADNHQHMIDTRAQKVANIANDLPPLATFGPRTGDVLVLGWGSPRGAITAATQRLQQQGHQISCAFLRHLNPLPNDLGALMKGFKKVVLPELNKGQLAMMLRAKYLVDVQSFSQVNGQPFKSHDLESFLQKMLAAAAKEGAR